MSPESEPQKEIALHTEQNSTPRTSVTNGRSSAGGAQPSVTTSTDQNTGTGDVSREVRTGFLQDVTRRSSNDDMGDDVVMRGDNVDENNQAPEFVGVRQQKEDHNEEGTT